MSVARVAVALVLAAVAGCGADPGAARGTAPGSDAGPRDGSTPDSAPGSGRGSAPDSGRGSAPDSAPGSLPLPDSGPTTEATTGPIPGGALALPPDAQPAVVVRHVDGDTLVLRGTGRGPLPEAPTRVRLLQVDTPEIGAAAECGGAEASARLAELLPVAAPVRVAADVDLLDRYGRTLLLVWDDRGRNVQEALVADGLATVLHVGRNDRALEALEAAQRAARAEGRGRWSACSTPEALPSRGPRLPDTGGATWLGAVSG